MNKGRHSQRSYLSTHLRHINYNGLSPLWVWCFSLPSWLLIKNLHFHFYITELFPFDFEMLNVTLNWLSLCSDLKLPSADTGHCFHSPSITLFSGFFFPYFLLLCSVDFQSPTPLLRKYKKREEKIKKECEKNRSDYKSILHSPSPKLKLSCSLRHRWWFS